VFSGAGPEPKPIVQAADVEVATAPSTGAASSATAEAMNWEPSKEQPQPTGELSVAQSATPERAAVGTPKTTSTQKTPSAPTPSTPTPALSTPTPTSSQTLPPTRTNSNVGSVNGILRYTQKVSVRCPYPYQAASGGGEVISPSSAGMAYLVGSHAQGFGREEWVTEWDVPSTPMGPRKIRVTVFCVLPATG
jgi:hypothetical protein